MANNLTLFMRLAIEEERLLRAMERIIGVACCSSNFPNEAAPVYFMPLHYSAGFQFGATLTWLPSLKFVIDVGELAEGLAKEFQTDVLFEAADSVSDTDQERWVLAEPSSELRVVKIKELPDGVCLAI